MMLKTKVTLAVASVIALLATDRGPAQAQDYPTKPIRLIVPYSAGGANDLLGRTFGEVVGEMLGHPLVVENRTGGAGQIGSLAAARAEPDGYTLLVSGMPSIVLSPAMTPSAPFDAIRDFTHIAYLGGPPNVLVVNNSTSIKTFKEFVDKATKENIQYVSPSVGSVGNMVAESMAAQLKLNLSHVAYRGGGTAIFDLVAGHVPAGCMTYSTTRPHLEAKKLTALAISTETRVPEAPELPTMKELGMPGLVTATWYSISGPANMPRAIVTKLNTAINKAFDDPRVKKLITDEALQTKTMSPEETTDYVRSEVDKWSALAKNLAKAK
jgi:tripartite-type tricarboxylate transporter receptor subunit TctC